LRTKRQNFYETRWDFEAFCYQQGREDEDALIWSLTVGLHVEADRILCIEYGLGGFPNL
jgi:hypothetical protein